ncbi:MAG: NUDIX hydrolase [Limnohabitans sp.]|nr:NUDIX hydrolase [Limnohabitans sp.]
MDVRWKPSVTVAAVIEKNGRFLLIEEETAEGLRLNNPAGHLDPGESPQEACAREALEETTHSFRPTALIGIYLSRFQKNNPQTHTTEDITYIRYAYCGELGPVLAGRNQDTGIVKTLWMTPQEVHDSAHLHRSPLVVKCMEDFLKGQRFPLEVVWTDSSVYAGTIQATSKL